MNVFPKQVEEKLGFDVLRARLESLVRSPLGAYRLDRMRLSSNLEWIRAELERVHELQEVFRFDDPLPLRHVLDLRGVLNRAAPEGALVQADDLLNVQRVLSTLRLLRQYFESRREQYRHLWGVAGRIVPMPELEEGIARVVDDEGRVRDDASPELARIRRLIIQKEARLRETLQRALREATREGYATEEQPTIRNGRMVIPIRAEAKRKVQGFVQDTSASGQTVYVEPAESLDLNNELRELAGEERREVERILRALTSSVRGRLDDIREDLRILAGFDLLQAKARLANEIRGVVPALNADGVIDIVAGKNPVLLLRFLEDGREVVPLDLTLGDAFHTLIITGPNAGGKTVAMKTVGLFALMLSYGIPIPVDERSQFSVFERLHVDIGDEQSIEEDLSTFSSHVANLRYMLEHAGRRVLVLIDEAGTGTDPAEGGALAQAVLERLTERGARTIATTHHGTLKVFAHEHQGVENGSMEFDQATLSPTYRFHAGIPGSSYAFEIASRMGLDASILERARQLVGEQKSALEELITTFEARTQELESKLAEASEAARRASHERETYRARAEKLSREREAIRRQALEEAERIVSEANARVERTIREIKEAQAEREATRAARARLEAYRQRLGDFARPEAEIGGSGFGIGGSDTQGGRIDTQGGRTDVQGGRTDSRVGWSESELGQSETEFDRVGSDRGGSGMDRDDSEVDPGKAAGRDKSERRRRDRAPAGGAIEVGDQVVLDDGSTAAEVLEIEDDEAVISFDSMRLRANISRLRKVGGKRKQSVSVGRIEHSGGDVAALSARSRIDVRGMRVEEALQEVTRLIDEALAARIDDLEILHGKGTGALRQAIQEYLSAREEVVSFEEAPWDQGGAGVTYVHLR